MPTTIWTTTSGTSPFNPENRSTRTGSATTTSACTRKIKPGVMCVRSASCLKRAASCDEIPQRQENDFQIERHAAGANVVQVPGEGITPIQKATTVDLRQSTDTGLAREFVHFFRRLVLHNLTSL